MYAWPNGYGIGRVPGSSPSGDDFFFLRGSIFFLQIIIWVCFLDDIVIFAVDLLSEEWWKAKQGGKGDGQCLVILELRNFYENIGSSYSCEIWKTRHFVVYRLAIAIAEKGALRMWIKQETFATCAASSKLDQKRITKQVVLVGSA